MAKNSKEQLMEQHGIDFYEIPLYSDEKEVSELFNISVSQLRKWRCNGKSVKKLSEGPKFVKIGGKILYKRCDLIDWYINQPSRRVL